eukprot:TRINITY_DN537_c0_g1_i5.p2 TRINITY_DN537_c0_g1~~TRINITY_DN537_c0_g1_i5.p2  ORF type:complete len:157 (-),score=38.62 TRINITY_DN537_c0_g1_i5:31-501(-)
MIRRPPRSTHCISSAASDVYKRQGINAEYMGAQTAARRQQMFNWVKTAILMAAIMALFGVVGGMIGGQSGMLMALVFGGAMNLFSYWFSDTMVLKMYNAQQVDETSAPQFYAMVRELAQRAGLPMPKVYIINEAQPNAFATKDKNKRQNKKKRNVR